MTLLAATCAGLAVLLVLGPVARLRRRRAPGPVVVGPGLVVVGIAAAVVLAPRWGALVLVVGGATLGGLALWRRRRRRRAAAQVSARVLETCELVAGELAAGHPPGATLERAAASWP